MRLQWHPEGQMSLKVMGGLLAVHGIAHLRLRCRTVRCVHSIIATRQSHSRTVRGIVRYHFGRYACLMRTKSRKQIRSALVPIRGHVYPYCTSIVDFPYCFTLSRDLGIQRFGQFIADALLEFRSPSRGKVRRWVCGIPVLLLNWFNGRIQVIFTLPLEVFCQWRVFIDKRFHGLQAFRFDVTISAIKGDAIVDSLGTVIAKYRRNREKLVTDGPSRPGPTAYQSQESVDIDRHWRFCSKEGGGGRSEH